MMVIRWILSSRIFLKPNELIYETSRLLKVTWTEAMPNLDHGHCPVVEHSITSALNLENRNFRASCLLSTINRQNKAKRGL